MFKLLAATTAIATLLAAPGAQAQTPPAPAAAPGAPPIIVIYKDALSAGWTSTGTATVALQVPAGNVKPIKASGDADTTLLLHNDHPVSTKGYNQLVFYINGGVEGGQTLTVKASVDGKLVEPGFVVHPPVKLWTAVEVKLKDIGATNANLDGVAIVGNSDGPYKPYYIDQMQLQ